MLDNFGNKPFMAHEVQGIPSYFLANYDNAEEKGSKKTIKVRWQPEIPWDAKLASSHVIQKIRLSNDDFYHSKHRFFVTVRIALSMECGMMVLWALSPS